MSATDNNGGETAPEQQSTEVPDTRNTINLKILSPSTEVPQEGLHFSNLPWTTTAGELKRLIQEHVQTKPAPSRQRLIYRGRVVARESDQLADVFGREQVQQTRNQNLHLVLSGDSATGPAPRPATTTPHPNPFRPPTVPPPQQAPSFSPPPQTNPFRAQNATPQQGPPRPQSQPPTHNHTQQIHVHAPIQVPPGTVNNPEMVHHLLAHQMAMAQQQILGQLPEGVRSLPQLQQQIQQQIQQQMPNIRAQIIQQQHRNGGERTPVVEGNPAPNQQQDDGDTGANAHRRERSGTSGGDWETDSDATSGSESEKSRPSSSGPQAPTQQSTTASGTQAVNPPAGSEGTAGATTPNVFQQVIAQQQQQRAAAGSQNGSVSGEAQQNQQSNSAPPETQGETALNNQGQMHRSTYVNEGRLPGGHRYTMTLNTNIQVPNMGAFQGFPGMPGMQQPGNAPGQPPVPVLQNDIHPPYPHTHPGQQHVHHHHGPPVVPPVPGGVFTTAQTNIPAPYPLHPPQFNGLNNPAFPHLPSPLRLRPSQQALNAQFRMAAEGTPRAGTPVGEPRGLHVPVPSRNPSPATFERFWGSNGLYNQLGHTYQALQNVARELVQLRPREQDAFQAMNRHRFDVNIAIVQVEAIVQRPHREEQLQRVQDIATDALTAARDFINRTPRWDRATQRTVSPAGASNTSGQSSDRSRQPSGQSTLSVPGGVPQQNRIPTPSGSVIPPGHQPAAVSPQTQLLVLSGPTGPYALLVGPTGRYTAPLPSTIFSHQSTTTQTPQFHQQPQPTPTVPAQQQQNNQQAPAQPADGAQPANQNANPAAPAQPQALDLDAWVANLWLLFKLFLFVYFFSGHSGWRRPIFLTLAASIIFLVQIGVFRQPWFDGIRRHFEAVLPLEARPAQNPPAQAEQAGVQPAGEGQNAQDAQQQPAAQAVAQQPTPEEAAARLLRQERDRQANWWRQHLMTAERGVALFLASLWPGVGERAVAARRREEEERRRLIEAAQQPQQPEGQPAAEDGNPAVENADGGAGGVAEAEAVVGATGAEAQPEGEGLRQRPQAAAA